MTMPDPLSPVSDETETNNNDLSSPDSNAVDAADSSDCDIPKIEDAEEGSSSEGSETDPESENNSSDNYPLKISAELLPAVNFALQQNGLKTIRSVTVSNTTDKSYDNLILNITTLPEISIPLRLPVDLVPASSDFEIRNIELHMDAEKLSALTEKLNTILSVELLSGEEIVGSLKAELKALAYDEWHGSSVYPELLSAFVTPNHPEIARINARAAELLGSWTDDPSLDAYQSEDTNRVLQQAAAVYAAIQEQNIVYAVAPASFETLGQRVRLCDMIMQQKMANCLDMTLLYASSLEAAGLHPILILKPGHIFAGVWLEDKSFPESVQDDFSLISKRLAGGVNEIAVIECTAMCAGKNISFDESGEMAARQLPEADIIIDVDRARLSGIKPLPLRIRTESGWIIERPELDEKDLTSAPKAIGGPLAINEAEDTPATRKLMWERKLLDLGLRNSLINLRLSKTVLPILTSSADELEDALADGKDFSILPRPSDIKLSDVSFDTMHELGDSVAVIKEEFRNHRLRSGYTEAELNRVIKELYRSSKTSIEENGANTLYMAMGLLRWYETPRSTKPRYAPLILIPIEMVRRSAASGYVIRLRDEDPQMNITLLEKLKQDFGIKISGLDPLPQDDHGINTRMVFTVIRKAVMQQKNWDVLESAYLGIFSFSQFVMWNDIKNRSEDLEKNKIVKSLMDGKLSWQAQEMNIGDHVPEDGVFLPLPADASQLFAIEAAGKGESFVLHGPPGTGKSQTITALIANSLAQGKTVLFVAEKMAALEVVQRRLDKIGLGPFCLELHSNKSKKRAVLEQLRQASEVTKNKSPEEYRIRSEEISALRKQLDEYARALHKPLDCGKTLYELINSCEADSHYPDISPVPEETVCSMTSRTMLEADAAVNKLVAAAQALGHPKDHPLSAVKATAYSQKLRMELPELIRNFVRSANEVSVPLKNLSDEFGTESAPFTSAMTTARLSAEAVSWFSYPVEWSRERDLKKAMSGLRELCTAKQNIISRRAQLLQLWKPDALSLDSSALLSEYRNACGKWLIAKSMGISGLVKKLNPYAQRALSKDELEQRLTELSQYQSSAAETSGLYDTFGRLLGKLDQGEATDWGSIPELTRQAEESAESLTEISGGEGFRMNICSQKNIEQQLRSFNSLWQNYVSKRIAVWKSLSIEMNGSLSEETALCSLILDRSDQLRELIAWNSAAEEAEALGLGCVVKAYNEGIPHEDAAGAWHKAISKALCVRAIDSSPILSSFTGTVFNERINRFHELDDQLTKLTQQEIYCRLAAKVPDFTREAAQSSELGIIQKAIRSGGRGVSIRKLFEQIPDMLPRLCPCMLMSPISAAQYLDPKRKPFDIVVFDEASQLQTCKAVGVLARAENAVIVGDPRQMPPTSFFSSNTVDEDNIEAEDLESILDDCLALNMPQTHLLWHYRSRHESLIAFSNRRFYENKLLTFPSANDREEMVRMVHVEGVFERGKNRQNRAEAEAVIDELKRRCHDKKLRRLSVGVVTFNINQQNLIDDLLTDACKTDPELEHWAFGSKEPLFIKNLENVQGDERDVILFSVGYGPDENGKVSLNFGPLNRDGGWRRLNVAVSRARCEMVVFSTLTGDMIDLSRTSSEGVAALKDFLDYAAGKKLAREAGSGDSEEGNEGIALAICKALEENGYTADRQVGHSGYRIDIGVIDPDAPEKYLLGILLDGPAYGSSRTTRDRELAQISVLNGLGWDIIRVWSIDWWDNSKKELQRILNAVEQAKNKPDPEEEPDDEEEIPEESNEAASENDISEEKNESSLQSGRLQSTAEKPVKRAARAKAYRCTPLVQKAMTAEEFVSPKNSAELRSRVMAVMNTEAPISESLLQKRILHSCGIPRSTPKVLSAVTEAAESLGLMKTTDGDRLFYWGKGQFPGSYEGFRASGDGDDRRDVLDVPSEEAVNAAYYVLYDMVSMSEEDLVREAAKLLNYPRPGSNINSVFGTAVELSIRFGGIVRKDNGTLALSDQGTEKAKRLAEFVTFVEH